MSTSDGALEIDIVLQFLADRRSSGPLEATVELCQYILDGNVVGLVTEPAGEGFAIPAGGVFEEPVTRRRISFEQAF